MKSEMPDIEPDVRQTAVSVYGSDAMDDFPVLKAFQQYIDAEQARARKRLVSLGIFFGILVLCLIAVFVLMLHSASQRNQMLNDRLVEFAMRERDRQQVVVQPPAPVVQQDSAALAALTAKIEELQNKLAEKETKAKEEAAEKARREASENARKEAAEKAAADAARKARLDAEEAEIRRQKALLAAEKEKLAAEELRRRREAELEEYRRKHYPEYYAKPVPTTPKQAETTVQPRKPAKAAATAPKVPAKVEPEVEAVEDNSLNDDDAIDYFKEETSASGEKSYSIPVDVRGSKGKWRIP